MTASADLAGTGVVDNHCHGLAADQPATVAAWRQFFTESPDDRIRTQDVAGTVFYRRLLRRMAAFHGLPPAEAAEEAEEEVLRARSGRDLASLVSALFADAGIEGAVIDTGYPPSAATFSPAEFTRASGASMTRLLRLEVAFADLVAVSSSYDDLLAAARELTGGARAGGYAGFKSIAAYRTGLAIDRWPAAEARAAYRAARAEAAATGSVRLGYKPLLDTLLHVAFAAAAEQELPVQFHVGYGDPDADLRTATPLALRAVLAEPAYRPMPVVLLHSCWPYFREGAYLAAVYGNAYLDLSFAIPFLSLAEMTAVTRAAVGAAPFSKLMYSSDGTGVPELHWLGALDGRRVLGTVLGELVSSGDLTAAEASQAGQAILAGNARRLYGVS